MPTQGTHGACWEQTAVGGKTDEPRIRIRRVARWHRLQESGCPHTRQTCAEGNLSRALLFTKDYLTALRRLKEKQTNKRCGQVAISEGNPPGDEYQRCQGLSRVAGDTPTIWGERWCALCGDDMNAHCADLIVWFLHKDWYYSAMHCKAASPGHDKDLFISTSCYGWWRSDCARLSERTLLDSNSGLNETRTPADESTASHNCV